MKTEFMRPDDGTEIWAAEEAAALIGVAFYRANEKYGRNVANSLMTDLLEFCRSQRDQDVIDAKTRLGFTQRFKGELRLPFFCS